MTPRDTRTGATLEEMVLTALRLGGYTCVKQAHVGERIGGGKHKVDVLAHDKEGLSFLVSLKWQQTGGTAEQKVPFEIISLADAVAKSGGGGGSFRKAYLVLGGDGWKLRDFYVAGGLNPYLRKVESVRVMALEPFLGLANRGQL